MRNITYTAKEVIYFLDLPYGRNTLYRKLRELGFLDETNYPSKEMQDQKLIIVRHPLVIRFRPVNVPIFTSEFLRFIEKYLAKIEAD